MLKSIQKKPFVLVLGWLVLALITCYFRDMWGDEVTKFDHLGGSLTQAFHKIFLEQAPFAHGEMLLDWLSWKFLSGFLPLNIWTRVPSLFFALLIWVTAITVVQEEENKDLGPLYLLLLFFSSGLMWYSTEMRSYSALMFNGALSFMLVTRTAPLKVSHFGLIVVSAFLGHIYGICFTAAALGARALLKVKSRQSRIEAGLCALIAGAALFYVWLLLTRYNTYSGAAYAGSGGLRVKYDRTVLPPVLDMVRQLFALLSNPKKVWPFFALLFVLGSVVRVVRSFRHLLGVGLFLLLILGPIFATVVSGYMYYPRQAIAGLPVFLYYTAAGIAALRGRFKTMAPALGSVPIIIAAVSWFFTIWIPVQPLLNNPFLKYWKCIGAADQAHAQNVMFANAWEWNTFVKYVRHRHVAAPVVDDKMRIAGVEFLRLCWEAPNQRCYFVNNDSGVSLEPRGGYSPGGSLHKFLTDPSVKIDIVLHDFQDYPEDTGLPQARCW